jgi:ribosomal subunit interface protein
MNRRIMFRHMDHSDAIEQYAIKHLQKIEHFLENEPTPCNIDLVLESSAAREYPRVELQVRTPHYHLITHHEKDGEDFYNALDHVIGVMYRLLLEEKQKHVDARKHGVKLEKVLADEEEEYGQEEFDDEE